MQYRRTFWTALLCLPLLTGAAAAQGKGKVKIKTADVTIKSGDEQIKGFLAWPEGKGPFPAVVVIQEWWGLNDWIKDNAKRLAGKGFVALAPDLYRGKVVTEMKKASALMKGLPNDRALRDLEASVQFLAMRPNVNKERIGSIGWCMGGGYSLQLAIADPRIKACVICYGRLINDPEKVKNLKATLIGFFGIEDKGIPAKGVREFEATLRKVGVKFEAFHIFNKAGHGFMRPPSASLPNPAYRAMQADDAWAILEEFLVRKLRQ